ncbi:hypothetical protein J7E50_04870 [Pedobacter sp. ISL-68]|uniref:hypothetical protein n=1 Tax=unclassified Pedobacter TaxID=2628915 RepID=UPI001BEA88DA|nr:MULTISPECIES: hypothetical protein [unclassified Pedobacter]MBT2563648.1 hypothetical protein [Pedobacter sp. ISL-64]MBT2589540.1 hypothetical protein [Pedobacter sp. ISL-68]
MRDRLFSYLTIISTEVKRNGEICLRDPSTTLQLIDPNRRGVISTVAQSRTFGREIFVPSY